MKRSRKIPIVAIVGRTNVGKSSLFNAILGRKLAVVKDEPGVTRDRKYGLVTRREFPFNLVDTGGLVGEEDNPFREVVRIQTEIAVEEADAIIAVFDGIYGLHPLDHQVVDFLRRSEKPIFWVVNKCENEKQKLTATEIYGLGVEEVFLVSAAHNQGLAQLIAAIGKQLRLDTDLTQFEERVDPEENVIRVAVVGRPNVGKSTLINRVLGDDRLVTADTAGTTRDSILVEMTREGQRYGLIDTAGLRKKARVEDDTVEEYSNLQTVRALVKSDVAVLILDATTGIPSDQDQRIAQLIQDRGKPLIIVVNKWDAVEKDHRAVKHFTDEVYAAMPYVRYAPILFVSALTGRRCPSVLQKAKEVFLSAQARVSTSDLNNLLRNAVERRRPATYRAEAVKLYFATQIASSPPTIVLFWNHPRKINGAYQRYLLNEIRKEFPFDGSPIKLILKKKTEKAARRGGEGARA